MVDIPLITLVIKSIIGEQKSLISSEDKSLIDTLSMLCSFLSVEDLCSFIYSEKFLKLTNYEFNLFFELGVYSKHDIILQLVAEKDKITLSDICEQNLLSEKTVECYDKNTFNIVIGKWLGLALC